MTADKFLNMKLDNGFKVVTKYVMNHDTAYRKSLMKGKTIDEKTDVAFFKGVYEILDTFMEELNKGLYVENSEGKEVKIDVDDDEFYYQYNSWLEGREELISNLTHRTGGKLTAKDKIQLAYLNGQREALETILKDLEKYNKSQRMKGHSYKAPVKKCKKSNVGRMVGNINGLENSVKKIF